MLFPGTPKMSHQHLVPDVSESLPFQKDRNVATSNMSLAELCQYPIGLTPSDSTDLDVEGLLRNATQIVKTADIDGFNPKLISTLSKPIDTFRYKPLAATDSLVPEPTPMRLRNTAIGDNVVSSKALDCLIPEPTPMRPCNIHIVQHVSVTALSWYNNQSLSSSIRSLLATEPQHSKSTSCQFEKFNDGGDSMQPSLNTIQGTSSKDHSERWNERYLDLVEFHRTHQHCLVPSTYPSNPSLGHWVKRQRYQYNLKINGDHSTLTKEREDALEKLGFVWDSHSAIWEERWNELRLFQERHGHCCVPKNCPRNPKLAIWIKCQRRQYKLFISGRESTITHDRIMKLKSIGFPLEPRSSMRKQKN